MGSRVAEAWKFAHRDATLTRKVSTAASTENAPDEDEAQQVRDDGSRITPHLVGTSFPELPPEMV